MWYDPNRHHRRSIRLKGYDYSKAGCYFVTICTKNREMLFGKIVEYTWFDLPNHIDTVKLDVFTIMPNHVHGIIVIKNDNVDIENDSINGSGMVRVGSEPTLTKRKHHPLTEIIRQFKTFSARRINKKRNISGIPVWHRNYYEHIIRDGKELNRIRFYIENNPVNWHEDDYYI